MKVFLSVPMNGRTDEQIQATKRRLVDRIEQADMIERGSDILDSDFTDEDFDEDAGYKSMPLAYFAKSLDMLARADVAVFAKGWQEARGCRIEHECAERYGIQVFEEEE